MKKQDVSSLKERAKKLEVCNSKSDAGNYEGKDFLSSLKDKIKVLTDNKTVLK